MALGTYRWTRDDLDRLPDDDGNRYEIIDGELLVTPAPRPAHEVIVDELGELLQQYCGRERLGRAFHGRSAVVTKTSHVEPDIVVRERLVPPPLRWDDVPLPLLVVEVLSDSSRRNDLVRKRALYRKIGVPEYWVVDGEDRTILIVTPEGERLERVALHWRPPPAQVAFTLDLPEFFTRILGPA